MPNSAMSSTYIDTQASVGTTSHVAKCLFLQQIIQDSESYTTACCTADVNALQDL